MKKRWIILIAIVLLALDQLTKFLISNNLQLYQEIPIIKNFFSLLYIRNTGAAFSIFEGKIWLFYLASLIGLIVVVYLFKTSKNKLIDLAATFLVAGILGNLIDRLIYQYVIDFLSFTFFGHSFAIFNLADSFITIAVILYLIDLLINEKKVKLWKK